MSDPTAVDSDDVREAAELPVIPPSIPRDDVASDGRVGAVAYPYRAIEATIAMERPFLSDREDTFFVSVDRSRRIALRADTFPETESMTVDDVLVLPAEVDDEQTDEMARESVFKWTLRKYSLNKPPSVEFVRSVDAYKLFWLAERSDGDVIVDSMRGDERPLVED